VAAVDLATRQRAHGVRRRALHSLSLALARHPAVVAHAWVLTRGRAQRLGRIAAIFAFVHGLAAAERLRRARVRDFRMAGLREGDVAAALLSAMLRAAGERARLEYTREMAIVRVAVGGGDVSALPPWARLLSSPAGLEVALAPRRQWTPAGYLPPVVGAGLRRRRFPVALAS
jgi:hypothetical protein